MDVVDESVLVMHVECVYDQRMSLVGWRSGGGGGGGEK